MICHALDLNRQMFARPRAAELLNFGRGGKGPRVGTGVSVNVPIGIREALVTALAETGLADNIDSLSLLLSVLSDFLDHPLMVPQHAVGRDHLVELINVCAKMESGLAAIVDAVRFLRPGSRESERVRQLVEDPQVSDLLPKADLVRLHDWLIGITSPHMTVLVQRAAGPGVPPVGPDMDAWEAFSYLTDFNAGPTGFPPAMAFLELLASQLTDEPKTRLTRWNDVQARRFRLNNELRELRTASAATIPPDSKLHLMIAVQPDGIDPNLYLLSHWRQDDPEHWPPPRGESRVTTFGQLERSIDEVVCGAETAWSHRDCTAALEFVLPRSLLNTPVHRWRKEHDSSDPRSLFLDYPIVVRSLERMASERWHRVWRRRWQTLTGDPSMDRVFFGQSRENLRRDQLEAALTDPRWGLMVLGASPPRDPFPDTDELTAALRSGLPALIWHPTASPEVLRALVSWLAEDGGLGDLPARTQASRLAALQESSLPFDKKIVRDLVLLWDNPERLAVFDRPPGQPRQMGATADDREEVF